jgi:hypothetical protein
MSASEEFDLSKAETPGMPEFHDPVDFQHLKSTLVNEGEAESSRGRLEDIDDHLRMIAREFSGQPMILFYHAWLIVHIRRGQLVKAAEFQNLWKSEPDYLIQHLNSRWLVSACDTFADIGQNDGETQLALATTLMMAVIKLYETEKCGYQVRQSFFSMISKKRQADKPSPFVSELFDGLTTFAVGNGDLIFNLLVRTKSVSERTPSIIGQILTELLRRLHKNDTVFKRMRDRHTYEGTRWDI